MKPIFMTYTKKDLINLAVCMVLSVLIIPTFIKTEYWYTSILIPWLCLALATIGQQIVMGYTGQLALGAAIKPAAPKLIVPYIPLQFGVQ